MSFPTMNAFGVYVDIGAHIVNDASGQAFLFLPTGNAYALFNVPAVVDVDGMELAMSISEMAGTPTSQVMASGASTFEVVFMDMGTTATLSTINPLADGDKFSNTRTGGYTGHEAVKALGTSTTDLDADDWVALQIIANSTALVGDVLAGVAFIYGKPGRIN